MAYWLILVGINHDFPTLASAQHVIATCLALKWSRILGTAASASVAKKWGWEATEESMLAKAQHTSRSQKEVNSPIGIVAITYCEVGAALKHYVNHWNWGGHRSWRNIQNGVNCCGLGLKPLDHVSFPWGYPNSWLVYKSL